MEQTTKVTFDKSIYNPLLFKSYKVAKKILKYSLYALLLYFAYEGFMAWE
jgi:HEPN domain-containing protein